MLPAALLKSAKRQSLCRLMPLSLASCKGVSALLLLLMSDQNELHASDMIFDSQFVLSRDVLAVGHKALRYYCRHGYVLMIVAS